VACLENKDRRKRSEIKAESARIEQAKRETTLMGITKTSLNLTVRRVKRTDGQMDWIGSRNQVSWLLYPIINFPVERVCCRGWSSCDVITAEIRARQWVRINNRM